MSRRLVLGLLMTAALAAVAVWLAMSLERVPVKTREPPQIEARRNPWLALERFCARMGGELTRSSDVRVLDRLPAGGTLMLGRQRAQLLTAERLRRLLAWVEAGGYLLAVAELPGVADPLLDSLGVNRTWVAEPAAGSRDREVQVILPGGGRPLRLAGSGYQLTEGERRPEWSAGPAQQGAQWLHFRLGQGQLTVATALDDRLNNRQIGKFDHAELFWSLLNRYDASQQPRVLLLARLEMPTLFAWLWQNAWAACLTALLLVALWLARIVPRFGRVRTQPPPARRELREHLAAIGRYQWRSRALEALLAPARAHFHRHLALRQPAIAALAPAAQAAALATLCQRPAVLITAALAGPAQTPRAFTDALRLLRSLERDLEPTVTP